MVVVRRLAALGVVLLATACGSEPPEAAEPLPPPVPVARPVTADLAALVAATDAFGLDLLTAPTLADRANLVVSP